jgi:hypothetical protein
MQVHGTESFSPAVGASEKKTFSSTWSNGVKGNFNISSFLARFRMPTLNFGIMKTYENFSQRIKDYFDPDKSTNGSKISPNQKKLVMKVRKAKFVSLDDDDNLIKVTPFNPKNIF